MTKETTTRNCQRSNGLYLAVAFAIAVGVGIGVPPHPALAHMACESDIAELKETIAHVQEHLEREERHIRQGPSISRRMARRHVTELQDKLAAARTHLDAAKKKPCPDTDTLEGQVEELQEKLDHLQR